MFTTSASANGALFRRAAQHFAGAMLACVTLVGCESENARVTFDGESFRGSAKAVDRENREVFTAEIRQASKSLEGAREALRYEGTKYCIRWFGNSRIDWDVDPQSDALVAVEDMLTLQGRCLG